MSHRYHLDYIIFWSSLLTVLIIRHKTNGFITDSNDLTCTHIQCPTKCPEDSYLKSAIENQADDFDNYEDEFLGHHDPYMEEIGNFEEIPPELELHDDSLPQHVLKERQRREVFFQEDIERCCDDQKCVCNKCPDVPKCAEGYVAIEVQEGHAVPGNCCSLFRCIKKEQCQLGVKQSWWTNRCRKCSCFGENELCEQICPEEEILQSCYSEYWQKPMLNGVFWKEGSCTSCSCELGERRCFTPVCPNLNCPETIKIEDECCAKCLHEIIDERSEIEEEYSTESISMVTPILDENQEASVTSHPPINETTSEGKSTIYFMPNIKPNISTTVQPELVEDFFTSKSSTSAASSSPPPTTLSTTLSPILKLFTSVVTSTEDILKTVYNTTSAELDQETWTESTTTEVTTFKTILEQIFSAAAGTTIDLPITSTVLPETSEELSTIERITVTEQAATDNQLNKSSSNSTEEYIEETSTTEVTSLPPLNISTAATGLQSATTNTIDFDFEANTTVPTATPLDITTDSTASSTNLISTFTPSVTTTHTTTNTNPDFVTTTMSHITIASTAAKDLTSSHATSTEHTSSAASSTEYDLTSTTSTTSSPYSALPPSKTTLNTEETTSTSSTSAPEPLRPLFQSYGDMTSEEGATHHNQMRVIFDEIDYVVIIGLFIGSLLCISLGLIIRHTKNRKKMYSSVPNSETSLSQNSTNTVLTIPSYRDNMFSSSN